MSTLDAQLKMTVEGEPGTGPAEVADGSTRLRVSPRALAVASAGVASAAAAAKPAAEPAATVWL